MSEIHNHTFRTRDTALAAYLMSQDCGVPQVDFVGQSAYFTFTKNNPTIETLIEDYDTAQAQGNIVLFFNAYQNLMRRIKERY